MSGGKKEHNRKIYDLVFSIGEACSCTQAIRSAGLQLKSYPLDWLFGSNFEGRCEILANRFENFINKKDLEYTYSERSIKCNAYHNIQNDITFNHDFLESVSFDEMYELVKKKYDRRIKRLLKQINKSKNILVVYIETPTKTHASISDECIIKSVQLVKDAYKNKNFDFLYFSNVKENFRENNITKDIKKIECAYKDYSSEYDYTVILEVLTNYLKNYQLKIPKSYIVRQKIIKFIINIIPNKAKRKNLRIKYHVQ